MKKQLTFVEQVRAYKALAVDLKRLMRKAERLAIELEDQAKLEQVRKRMKK